MSSTKLVIAHESALEFWRKHDIDPSGRIKRVSATSLKGSTARIGDIIELANQAGATAGVIFGARHSTNIKAALSELALEELPLHVLVGDNRSRRMRQAVTSHLVSTPLPRGALCKIDRRVFVTSPEQTLADMAAKLQIVDLLEICFEFCGGYALSPETERGFIDRPSLTSQMALERYAKKVQGRPGAKRFRSALRYVIDDSASPMETVTTMLLCLPSKLGGYQLPMPKSNVMLTVTPKARSHTSRKYLKTDLYWSEAHLDLECDSTRYHSSKEALGRDADKRITLEAMGIACITVSYYQLERDGEFDNVADAVRRKLGLRAGRVPHHIRENRHRLREYLVTRPEERRSLRLTREPQG